MAAPATTEKRPSGGGSTPAGSAGFQPYVADNVQMAEFTWSAVIAGVILGILFGASSLYLVLRVGITVSASIPVAVLSITLFRGLARAFKMQPATILENNIVQTTGSAGESIAFGVGVTMPALLLLGHDMSIARTMTVASLGGLLGILMMIPLRRAFIVQQHGKLRYPEGTACADVLIVGEEGGATARTVFAGFGLAFLYKALMKAMGLWKEDVSIHLYSQAKARGLQGGILGCDLSPELLGVGYIIGPRIASVMMAGGVLASLALVPLIVFFGVHLRTPVAPAAGQLITDMSVDEIHKAYILYIGAGAVATGGIISMFQSLPMIIGSLRGALGDMAISSSNKSKGSRLPRTQRDLPLWLVISGSIGLVLALAASPWLGLGFSLNGLAGALFIVLFGFLFVTVSSRLTGEIGSSSNPISGMTVATLLLTCMGFILLGHTGKGAMLTALTVAAVVCIAASNGGTTSQDLKTGFLVGATPRSQQIAILIGALTSAAVIGGTLLLLNDAGTVYTRKARYLPTTRIDVKQLTQKEQPGGEYGDKDSKSYDSQSYHVLHAARGEYRDVPPGKYLVDDSGRIRYYVDPAVNGVIAKRDDGTEAGTKFNAPKTRLMALIIDGMLGGSLPWELVLIGAVLAVVLELAGVPSLPFAVGVYLPIMYSAPIFVGGLVRWFVDKTKGRDADDADTSPGVLLCSGYIAGGSIAGVLIALLSFAPDLAKKIDMHSRLGPRWNESIWPAVIAFSLLAIVIALAGLGLLFKAAGKQRSAK